MVISKVKKYKAQINFLKLELNKDKQRKLMKNLILIFRHIRGSNRRYSLLHHTVVLLMGKEISVERIYLVELLDIHLLILD